jgi:hypothetical protein
VGGQRRSGHGAAGPPPILSVDTPTLDAFERSFETDGVRRSDLGYRRLYSRCWEAHLHDDLAGLLGLAAEPNLSPDMLATIAPDARDHDAPAELIHLILDHPACTVGVAGRFATHPDPTIRLRVARFPGLLTSSRSWRSTGTTTCAPPPLRRWTGGCGR